MAVPTRNIIFGFEFPEAISNSIYESTKNIDTLFDLRFVYDLFKVKYPIINTLKMPLDINIFNKNSGRLEITPYNYKINDVLFDEDPSTELIWDNIFESTFNIVTKLGISSVSRFALRQISIVKKNNFVQGIRNNFNDFLVENKVLDNHSQVELESNIIKYVKKNKVCIFKIEPYLQDRQYDLIDLDISFEMELPFKNLKDLIRQEIKNFITLHENYNIS